MENLDDPTQFETLSDGEKTRVMTWIATVITPANKVNERWCSYTLKHEFERSPVGFYLTNGQFKGAMLRAEYEPTEETRAKQNWQFRITFDG